MDSTVSLSKLFSGLIGRVFVAVGILAQATDLVLLRLFNQRLYIADLLRFSPDATSAWSVARAQFFSTNGIGYAAGAALVDAHGHEAPVLPVWQEAPLALGKFKSVVVEAEASPGEVQGPYTLKLWEAGGLRSVTLEGVVFPDLPANAEP